MNGIDLRGFRVVYEGVIYNALCSGWYAFESPEDDRQDGIFKSEYLEIFVINADGLLTMIRDKSTKFQFLRIIDD